MLRNSVEGYKRALTPFAYINKPNTRKAAAFYWILWKAKLSGNVTGQLEDKNSKKLTDFVSDDLPTNGIPDVYEKAKHLHIQ